VNDDILQTDFFGLRSDPLRFGANIATSAVRRVELCQVAQIVERDLAGELVIKLVVEIVWEERRSLCSSN
jgi:hypothetical protein